METILISLVYILLNTGLYLVFVVDDRLRINRPIKIIFFIFFLIFSILWVASENTDLQLIKISISLLGLYLLGAVVLLFITKSFEMKNVLFGEKIKQGILFIILPLYTMFVTTVQILLLYDVINT